MQAKTASLIIILIALMFQEKESIQKFLKVISQVKGKLEGFVMNHEKECIFFLGATGAGKSTLINALMGAQLRIKTEGMKQLIYNQSKGNYPDIGNDGQSCTRIPAAYGKFVDSAGFLDTKGVQQEIINSFATTNLFKKGIKTKIVLVLEEASLLSSRGKGIADVANRLSQLFPEDFQNLIQSITLVVSKTSGRYNLQQINQQLQGILKKNHNLSQKAKEVMEKLVQKNQVVMFSQPKEIDGHYVFHDQIIETIRRQIDGTPACFLSRNASVSLSEEAKLQMKKLVEAVEQDMQRQIKQIQKFLENKYKKTNLPLQTYESNLRLIRKASSILNIEYSFSQELGKFAKKIKLKQQLINKLLQNNEKLNLYKTIFSQIKPSKSIFQRIIFFLCQLENFTEGQIKDRKNEQNLQKMDNSFRQTIKKNESKHQEQMNKMIDEVGKIKKEIQFMKKIEIAKVGIEGTKVVTNIAPTDIVVCHSKMKLSDLTFFIKFYSIFKIRNLFLYFYNFIIIQQKHKDYLSVFGSLNHSSSKQITLGSEQYFPTGCTFNFPSAQDFFSIIWQIYSFKTSSNPNMFRFSSFVLQI